MTIIGKRDPHLLSPWDTDYVLFSSFLISVRKVLTPPPSRLVCLIFITKIGSPL